MFNVPRDRWKDGGCCSGLVSGVVIMARSRDVEEGGVSAPRCMIPVLPKPLTLEEKKYLLAVERGDMANVRRILEKAHRTKNIDINCVDSFGRGALVLAIDRENLEMVELLVVMGVETKDALLLAINAEFVEAVELLLEHEELIHKPNEPYSWQKVDYHTSMFTPDITPLMLAAHRNNYEIIKMLLDRGATLPDPHNIRCGCDDCVRDSTEDPLRHTMARLNEYRALASPSLIALSSNDPILTAFRLSWELRNMAFSEQESKSEYLELRRIVQKFAVDLLDQSRSSQELDIILNYDPDQPPFEGDVKLARLEVAIDFKQKKFVAHPNIQQLLASIWYEGVPGFRRKSTFERLLIICRVALLFPFYCCVYMVAPNCSIGQLMRKPFMKFMIHASSYMFFLLILILVSLRVEVQIIQLFGQEWMVKELEQQMLEQRGNLPTYLELIVFLYVLGFIYQEAQEMYVEGMRSYLRNLWNVIDFSRNSLYVTVAILRCIAYAQQIAEIEEDPQKKFVPREDWDDFDPQLVAEGLFAAANIFSALKLVHLFSINPHLGPLQISLGRMVIDIVKFFFFYTLVLFAFACGLNQLLWYFADLEKRKCYVLPGGLPDWSNAGDHCMKWRSFGNVFEASQSLFWASFGMVGLENFELAGIKSYTRFWGLLMFGSYSVINVIVLLNLLIAMMSNSYAIIEEHSDVEWKFARARLWMSYFEEISTLPPPFNVMPTPKLFMKIFRLRKKDKIRNMKMQDGKESEHDIRYTAVMRALVWRYVAAMQRKMDDEPVTEDDVNELKGDVSALRYELLDVFEKNGMDVSFTKRKEKMVSGKRMKVWERRLMTDFRVAPIAAEEGSASANEDCLSRFRRVARMAVAASKSKWDQTLAAVGVSSQIGRCRTRGSIKNQLHLQCAINEAKRLVQQSPLPGDSRAPSPIEMPISPGHTLKELIREISTDYGDPVIIRTPVPGSPRGTDGANSLVVGTLLNATVSSREVTPSPSPSELVSRSPSPLQRPVSPMPVARPVPPSLMHAEGALPPPPAAVKAKLTIPPTMEITPCTPIVARAASPQPKQSSNKVARSPKKTPAKESRRSTSPTSQTSPTTSSVENLLPPSPPPLASKTQTSTPTKPIKRQPRTGWI